jgi:hypothetical protein
MGGGGEDKERYGNREGNGEMNGTKIETTVHLNKASKSKG